jgi:hypothetical protein
MEIRMKGMELTFKTVERNLGVIFPPLFRRALCAKPMRHYVQWTPLLPQEWNIFSDRVEGLSDGKVVEIGRDLGGDSFCLTCRSSDSIELGEEIYRYNHESGELVLAGNSIAEPDLNRALLSKANRLLGDELCVVDEEDTF